MTRILALLVALTAIARAALPSIDTPPASTTKCVGTAASFSVVASSDSTTNYQWYFNETNAIADATNDTYAIASVSLASAGGYSVVVSNNDGAVTSVVATLTVNALTTATGVTNTTTCPGGTAVFTVTPGGAGPFNYAWRKDGAPLAETSATLTLAGVTATDAGTYSVEVTGACDTATNSANLVVVGAPTISAQPQSQTTPMGNGAVFSVTASTVSATVAPLSYQWRTNGVDVTGATGSSFAISNLSLSMNGTLVDVIVSNCGGTAASAAATLNVTLVSGISFDFDTPGQYTNAPYYLIYNNWLNNGFLASALPAPAVYENPIGGTGPYPGSGGLEMPANNANENTSMLLPVNFDFSLAGKAVYASTMFKVKAPVTANRRSTQIGLITSTNFGINDVVGQSFATVIVQAPTAGTASYELRTQRRVGPAATGGAAFQESVVAAATPLTLSNWYRLTVSFVNTRTPGDPTNFTITASLQDMGAFGTTPGATVASFTTTTNHGDIVNFKNVFFALRSFEDGGVDARDNTCVWTTPGDIFFVQEPMAQTVAQGDRAEFRAYVDGAGPYKYTWQRDDGSGSFTNIPFGGAWNHILPPARVADNGAQFRVIVDGPANSITSAPVTLTVAAETLALLSAGSVDGTSVGLEFNQPVDPATAENPANYTIDGVAAKSARIYRTSLSPLGPEGIYVLLTPASPVSGSFTVVASGIQDLSGGTIGGANSAAGSVANLTGLDVNPLTGPPGENYSFGPGQFIVRGGGADISGGADGFRFVYRTITGDFDLVYRVPFMDTVRFTAKAGLNARTSLDPYSPAVTVSFNPGPAAEGSSGGLRQFTEGNSKSVWGGGNTGWGTNRRLFHPDVWLRFRRSGNTFLRYASTNGVDWLFDGQVNLSPAPPETLYVGLAVSPARNLFAMSAEFESFGSFAGYSGATIAITSQPQNFTVNAGSSSNISVTATISGGGAPAAGEIAYVWQRSDGLGGFTNLPTAGQTNNVIAIGPLWSDDNGAVFRCVLKAPGAADAISDAFTATVNDTTAPTVSSVNPGVQLSYPVSELVINFSELMGDAALNTANYLVTNAAGAQLTVTGVEFLNGDRRTVVVHVDGALGTGNAAVGISGAQDLNGNSVATTVRTFRSFAAPLAPVVMEVYMDIGAGTNVSQLTSHTLFTANQPTLTVYSNLFGFNVGLAGSTIPRLTYTAGTTAADQYGVRAYTYFVPPTNGQYKFWIRSDDSGLLFLNTNAVNSTDPAGKTLIVSNNMFNGTYSLGSVIANSVTNITLAGGQPYYMEFLLREGSGGDGFSVMFTHPSTTTAPAATAFIPTANLAFPSSMAAMPKAITEIYTGYPDFVPNRALQAGIAEGTVFPPAMNQLNAANFAYIAGLPNGTQGNPAIGYQPYFGFQPQIPNTRWDDYIGRLYSYFVAPSNGVYKFWMRVDDVAQFYMNTNAVNSTDPAGKVLLGNTGNAFVSGGPYIMVASNITLTSGQRYYMEALWKEGGSGDGVAVAVRANSDNTQPATNAPPPTIAGSMLEFPTDISRSGAVQFDGIATASGGVVADGSPLLMSVKGLRGSWPYGGFIWYKNGVKVQENLYTNSTPPLTMVDNGAVYTVVVTNLFSSASRSLTVTVLPDTNAPTVVRCSGFRNGDGFSIVFSEPMDAASATALGNYMVSPGLLLRSATLDSSRRIVSFQTGPQAPGTTYTVMIDGVKDASSSGTLIASGTTTTFSTWAVGGRGYLVELFTNIVGGTIGELAGAPKFAANLPDVVYYTNVFGIGPFNANSGMDNYGGRISGYFVPTNTGYYRFYARSDDSSQFFMNVNSGDSENPAGKTLLVNIPGASLGYTNVNAISIPVLLNSGQRYYMEALLKEGTGGDYLSVSVRASDANGVVTDPIGGAGGFLATEIMSEAFSGGASGNPDLITITGFPQSELSVTENEFISLTVTVSAPNLVRPYMTYLWQKFDGVTYTNIPGATGSNYSFFANCTDDGAMYRVVFSAPGANATYTTLFHVATDVEEPYAVSANSLDGTTIGIAFNEPVDPGSAGDPGTYMINGDPNITIASAVVQNDPSKVLLTLLTPISGPFTLDVLGVNDRACSPNFGMSATSGGIQQLSPSDIGAPAGVGSSFTSTNNEIDIVAGGADIWGTSDQGHMLLGQRSGDFDVWARLDSLSRAPLDNDGITKAGIMVRETLDANARKLHYLAEPPAAIGGRDIIEAGVRVTPGGGTAAWFGGNGNNGQPAGIPNTWVRIKRVGHTFTAYRSADGVNWVQTTSHALGFSNTVYVGLAATAHMPTAGANPSGTTLAKFRNVHVPVAPTITAQPSPAGQTLALHGSASYSVAAFNPPDAGALTYQWYRNGAVVAGATSDTLNIADLSGTDSGTYTVKVGNDGGQVESDPVSLTVVNETIVVTNDSLSVTQGTVATIPAASLTGNDNDPEMQALSIVGVSGAYPWTFESDFNSGLPAGAGLLGSAVWDSSGGVGNSGVVKLTPASASQGGVLVVSNLTGRSVTAFNARFKILVTGGSGNPADGFSFSLSSAIGVVNEEGSGAGLAVAFDNYDNGGGEAPAIDLKWNNTVLASTKVPKIQSPVYLDVAVRLTTDGKVDVSFGGSNVYSGFQTPYTPVVGSFLIAGRTGGEFEAHWIDDVSIATVTTLETSRAPDLGSLQGTLNGNAYVGGGYLHITDNVNSQNGSFILNELTPGQQVTAFNASFKLRIGSGTGNAADGFSFNFANDLPALSAEAEEGAGTGLSLCIDNYPTGGPDAPAFKLKYGGTLLGQILIPKWSNPNFIPVTINVDADGTLDVTIDGTNVVADLATPWTPSAGRFGLYARTGGENETHWVDDLAINVTTASGSASYAQDFNGALFGTVTYSGGVVTYTPPGNACGTDTFYYLVTDNLGDTKIGQVNVTLVETNPQPPVILACVTNRTLVTYTNSQIALADLRGELVVVDTCGALTIAQDPAPGTLLNEGTNTVTFTVTDVGGLTAVCTADVILQVNRPSFVAGSASYNSGTGTFTALFQTANGVSYRVEYADSLTEPVTWNLLMTIAGDGTVQTITDAGPLPNQRYYRIVPQP